MRLFAGAVLLSSVAFMLAGCALLGATGSSTGNSSPTAPSTSAPEVHPTPSGPQPNFQPAVDPTSAQANQRLFVILLEQAILSEGISANPAATAERLRASGFDAAGISWTDSSTAIGLLSDTVFVSAQVGSECLVGQYGPSIQTIAVAVAPVLPAGGCLVGADINRF